MNFALDEDQDALVAALQAILADHDATTPEQRLTFCRFDAALQETLAANGFLDAARAIGPLEAALVVLEAARLPVVTEVAASGLVAPMALPDEVIAGPIAIIALARIDAAHRNLPIARHALIDCGDGVAILPVDPANVIPVESIYAYPYGRFRALPDLAAARRIAGAGPRLRQWWRVALALEIAGAAERAIAFTVDYVKQRQAFGHAIGAFQSVQHRLVQRHAYARSLHYLALRAAWSEDATDADLAAAFAQSGVRDLLFDLHQFNGAMGVTTEHLLHFWTYRIRALQAEAGGMHAISLAIAESLWPAPEAA